MPAIKAAITIIFSRTFQLASSSGVHCYLCARSATLPAARLIAAPRGAAPDRGRGTTPRHATPRHARSRHATKPLPEFIPSSYRETVQSFDYHFQKNPPLSILREAGIPVYLTQGVLTGAHSLVDEGIQPPCVPTIPHSSSVHFGTCVSTCQMGQWDIIAFQMEL